VLFNCSNNLNAKFLSAGILICEPGVGIKEPLKLLLAEAMIHHSLESL